MKNGFGIAVALSIAAAACGSSVDTSSHASGSTTGAGGGATTTGVGGGGATTTGVGGGGGGKSCGGFANVQCAPDEFCNFLDDSCGGTDGTGTCMKRPNVCSDGQPVCGCDGKTYDDQCVAQMAGVDVALMGSCPAPPDMFACGSTFCSTGMYCRRSTSDVGGVPDSYDCVALPDTCNGAGSCDCLKSEPCGDFCEAKPGGGFQLTCPGG